MPHKIRVNDRSYEGQRGGRYYIYRGQQVAIPVRKGELTGLGYKARSSQRSRRAALRRSIKMYGKTSVGRKLNALYVFNKNRHPDLANIFARDKQYVRGAA